MIRFIELEECESTNDEAWKQAPGPALVTARRQTRGRGRQGRKWESGESHGDADAIAMSLVMPPPTANMPWLPLAAGVAAAEAVSEACSILPRAPDFSPFRIKWPNDLMLGEAKLGGILCESRVVGEKVAAVVVGLGLNFRGAPSIDGLKTASLVELAPSAGPATRHFLIRHWADRMLHWCDVLSADKTPLLREAWQTHAKLDRYPSLTVHTRDGKDRISVIAYGLDDHGRLVALMGCETVFLDQADTL